MSKFRLEISIKEQSLYYGDKVLLDSCDDIVQLMLELGISDEDNLPLPLRKFDLGYDELQELEQELAYAILQKDICMPKIEEDEQ